LSDAGIAKAQEIIDKEAKKMPEVKVPIGAINQLDMIAE